MADTDEIYKQIQLGAVKMGSVRAWSLVPNRKGLERALKVGVTHIAVFTAATESFAKKNIGMSVDESLTEFKALVDEARNSVGKKLQVRGYVSTAFGCPFEGKVQPKKALRVVERLAELGVDQISIGDTVGVGTPAEVDALMKPALKMLGVEKTAVHLHDTRGTALANALRAYELGVRTFDSSSGGLGGCPFAPGASGNLATEDLVYMLDGMGIQHGVDIKKLSRVSLWVNSLMNHPVASRYLQSFASRH
jgi:hydroxymethylglutaryl-CoA lyase